MEAGSLPDDHEPQPLRPVPPLDDAAPRPTAPLRPRSARPR